MAKEFKISTLRLKELEQELHYLKTTREKEVAEQIKGPFVRRPLGKQRI